MVIKNVQYFSEMDELRESLYAECPDEYARPKDIGNDRITIWGPLFRLRGTTLIIAEGTYYVYDEDSDSLEPSFSVSLLYNAYAEPDLDNPLYWEESSPATMFHHFAIMQEELGIDTKFYLNKGVA